MLLLLLNFEFSYRVDEHDLWSILTFSDIILNPHPAITFRTTGGILDFYIFLGPTPADVISQFAHKVT